EDSELKSHLEQLLQPGAETTVAPLPQWLISEHAIEELTSSKARVKPHPAGGLVIVGPPPQKAEFEAAFDDFGDEDDSFSAIGTEVALTDHLQNVARWA